MTANPQFIVAEVSKNWINGAPVTDNGLLSQIFERVIEVNRQRGYRLYSFSLHRLMTGPDELMNEMNETIIAVFELESCRSSAVVGSDNGV